MPFVIQGGNDLGTILAGLKPMRDPTDVQESLVKLRQAQQEQSLFPLRKQEAELTLKGQQFAEQERQYGLRERDAWQQAMTKYGADYEKARPELATQLRPTTLAAMDKIYMEHAANLADVAKKKADAAKIAQELQDREDEVFGSAATDIQASKYSPVTFDSLLDKTQENYPQYKQHVADIRQRVIDNPDSMQQIVDAMVTPKARAAAQELAQKTAQIAKEKAETELTTAKVPGEQAESAKKQAEMRALTGMKDSDWQNYIDRVIEDHSTPLYRRTQQMVQFYRNQGNLKAADDAVKQAGEQLGRTEAAVATARATAPIKIDIASKEALAKSDAGGLTDDDYARAGEQYMRSGVMPAVGRDSITRNKIVKAGNAWARDNGFNPADILVMQAAYKGDVNSLKQFQANRDNIASFEQTAQKNLDLMLAAGKKLIDTGSPYLNKPLRSINRSVLGSDDQAAFDAAQLIAQNEVAKVTSGGGLGGVVSDTAKREMKEAMGENPTISNMMAVAKILKADMKNRHESMDATLSDIKSRIGGGGGGAAAGGGQYKRTATGPGGHKVGTNDVDAAGNPKKDAAWFDVQTGKRL